MKNTTMTSSSSGSNYGVGGDGVGSIRGGRSNSNNNKSPKLSSSSSSSTSKVSIQKMLIFTLSGMLFVSIQIHFLSFNSSSFEVISSKGIIAISGDEISGEDVDRVLDMAKNGVDLPNREILKVIPEYFIVDLEE